MVGELTAVSALGTEVKCPVCKKVFLRKDLDWAYQRSNSAGTKKYFCSWGCMRKYEEKYPKRDCIGHGTYGG